MRKSLLKILISCLLICTSLFVFTACFNKPDTSSDTRDQQIVSVYNAYVVSAESSGETPLSYEEWLVSIQGKSVYELYKQYHPNYNKAEEEFLSDLINNRLDGQEDENPQGLDFYLLDDGTYAVGAGKAIYLSTVTIPSTYKGKAVTKIADYGFAYQFGALNNICLNSINIPSEITIISHNAFCGCVNLTSVTFENTSGWKAGETELSSDDLSNPSNAAILLKSTYYEFDWTWVATVKSELSMHFLMLGNALAGDCIYIKAGDVDILVDGGSRAGSVPTTSAYIDNYVTDGKLEYVIVTHADQDHIAGFAASNGLFDRYVCETIIDFPKTDKTTQVYNNYVSKRDAEVSSGATHYTALQCYNNSDGASRNYQLTETITLTILYNYFYDHKSSDENNYSVCFMITDNDRKFLFTGDLEKKGEEYLVQYNSLSQVELFKAGHHGSPTSSTMTLLNVIRPKICVVTCVAGTAEYTSTVENQFPSQAFINNISNFTDKVYVTTEKDGSGGYKPLNGNVVVVSGETVTVNCSESDVLLKDSEWFKAERTCPPNWQN